MKKIFVGNLSWKVTEEILKPLFEAYGNVVSIKIIVDQYTKSKGFGFVEMDSADAATKSIDELNDKPLLERNLRVSLAQERTDRGSSDRGERSYNNAGGNSGGGSRDFRNSNAAPGGQRSFRPRERNFNA